MAFRANKKNCYNYTKKLDGKGALFAMLWQGWVTSKLFVFQSNVG